MVGQKMPMVVTGKPVQQHPPSPPVLGAPPVFIQYPCRYFCLLLEPFRPVRWGQLAVVITILIRREKRVGAPEHPGEVRLQLVSGCGADLHIDTRKSQGVTRMLIAALGARHLAPKV